MCERYFSIRERYLSFHERYFLTGKRYFSSCCISLVFNWRREYLSRKIGRCKKSIDSFELYFAKIVNTCIILIKRQFQVKLNQAVSYIMAM